MVRGREWPPIWYGQLSVSMVLGDPAPSLPASELRLPGSSPFWLQRLQLWGCHSQLTHLLGGTELTARGGVGGSWTHRVEWGAWAVPGNKTQTWLAAPYCSPAGKQTDFHKPDSLSQAWALPVQLFLHLLPWKWIYYTMRNNSGAGVGGGLLGPLRRNCTPPASSLDPWSQPQDMDPRYETGGGRPMIAGVCELEASLWVVCSWAALWVSVNFLRWKWAKVIYIHIQSYTHIHINIFTCTDIHIFIYTTAHGYTWNIYTHEHRHIYTCVHVYIDT